MKSINTVWVNNKKINRGKEFLFYLHALGPQELPTLKIFNFKQVKISYLFLLGMIYNGTIVCWATKWVFTLFFFLFKPKKKKSQIWCCQSYSLLVKNSIHRPRKITIFFDSMFFQPHNSSQKSYAMPRPTRGYKDTLQCTFTSITSNFIISNFIIHVFSI